MLRQGPPRRRGRTGSRQPAWPRAQLMPQEPRPDVPTRPAAPL